MCADESALLVCCDQRFEFFLELGESGFVSNEIFVRVSRLAEFQIADSDAKDNHADSLARLVHVHDPLAGREVVSPDHFVAVAVRVEAFVPHVFFGLFPQCAADVTHDVAVAVVLRVSITGEGFTSQYSQSCVQPISHRRLEMFRRDGKRFVRRLGAALRVVRVHLLVEVPVIPPLPEGISEVHDAGDGNEHAEQAQTDLLHDILPKQG